MPQNNPMYGYLMSEIQRIQADYLKATLELKQVKEFNNQLLLTLGSVQQVNDKKKEIERKKKLILYHLRALCRSLRHLFFSLSTHILFSI